MFCYIKNGALDFTSDELITKRQDEVRGENGEIVSPFVDGLVYDEVIETKLTGRVEFECGKIIAWEKSEAKRIDDERIAQEQKAERIAQIEAEIANLQKKIDILQLIDKDATKEKERLEALKQELSTLL